MELDTSYDLIVLGTGFVESVIAGAAARSGKKVLHLDYNGYYGGYTSSSSLSAFEKLLTTPPEGPPVAPSSGDWPSGSIPVSSQPVPKFTNVKIYANHDLTTVTTTESSENTSSQVQLTESTEETKPNQNAENEKKDNENTDTEKTDNATTDNATTDNATTDNADKSKTENEKVENEASDKPETIRSRFVPYEQLIKSSRHFSIDILPRLLFSRGEMVNLLINSSVGRYLEFKCLEMSYLYTANTIQPVPCSKGDIFKSKNISNSERRMLTRFMQLVQSDLEEAGKINPSLYDSFYEFIKSQNLSPNLETFVLYAISMCTSNQLTSAEKVSAAQGLRILETYVSSISKYGNTPFLCPLYGVSELPQAFCRLCAVYGGIYMMCHSANCLLVDEATNKFRGIISSEGQTLNATHFVTSGSYVPDLLGAAPEITKSSRCVVITDAPLLAIEQEQGQASFLIIPPHADALANPDPDADAPDPDALANPHAIHVLQFDHSLSVAAKGKYVLHFVTETTKSAELDLERAVAFFLNVPQAPDSELSPSKPYALWVCYFDLNLYDPASPFSTTYPKNVYVVSEGTADTGVDFKAQLDQAREVFLRVCPGEEFLPRVPNPEDVIWSGGNEGTETTEALQGDNNDKTDK